MTTQTDRSSEKLVTNLATATGGKLIETHISWLILCRDEVYKIKKPLDLGFLDFSTLDARKYYCEEEVRLNRRTAPWIYRGVVAIAGSADHPAIAGDASDAAIEYAVRMARFDDSMLLDRLASEGSLDDGIVKTLAAAVAGFHRDIADEPVPADLGTAEAVREPVAENFKALAELDHDPDDERLLAELERWSSDEFARLQDTFDRRRESGFVRECHGDLHLGNIFVDEGAPVLFDCIEFNESLRWIDVVSDIAFAVMDLHNFELPEYGNLLLNEYLALTGDYDGACVLDWYLTYRAVVRAKVAAIRARQEDHGDLHRQCRHYLELANNFTQSRDTPIILMCGLSGSGKTTIARKLAAEIDALHLRSDVERKRLFGLAPYESSHRRGKDIYTPDATEATFARLEALAGQTQAWRRATIVDATFIERPLRERFAALADRLGVPWVIVECTASEAAIRERLAARTGDASEAGIAQYLDQRSRFQPFDDREQSRLVRVDTAAEGGEGDLARAIRQSIAAQC